MMTKRNRTMKPRFKAAMMLALLVTLVIGLADRGRACEPNSAAFGAFCYCEESGLELSGQCYDIGGELVRRGMMNIPQHEGSRLEYISFKVTSPEMEFPDQFITLSRSDNACPIPGATGIGCTFLFNVGQPPGSLTLRNIENLEEQMRTVAGRRQNIFFNVTCDSLAGAGDVTDKRYQAVALVGLKDGTGCHELEVKVQERPRQGDIFRTPAPCS
jgi:hypothetical protein